MPDTPRLVIANTTPTIALSLIGQQELLHRLYGRVLVPNAVQAEILAGRVAGIGIRELRDAAWVDVASLRDPSRADLITDLERGEAEVFALAQELNADLVIIDETEDSWPGLLPPAMPIPLAPPALSSAESLFLSIQLPRYTLSDIP